MKSKEIAANRREPLWPWREALLLILGLFIWACESPTSQAVAGPAGPYLRVLGIAQDAGYPQLGCTKACCARVHEGEQAPARVTCLGIVDPESGQCWLLDATPDLPSQWDELIRTSGATVAGILPTHAHIGHYTGLMYLGREALGAQHLPVCALPRMDTFLRHNGPWSQLVSLGNIDLRPVAPDLPISLSPNLPVSNSPDPQVSPSPRLQVTPLLVPHRDEFSETAAWLVKGPEKTLLYLPDIDKWDRWERDIRALIRTVDYAFLDATFFDGDELPNRDMAEIPHPFVVESLALFEGLPAEERAKIIFTHFNHSNPLLQAGSAARVRVEAAGMHVAAEGMVLGL